jgi:hypothetical protein
MPRTRIAALILLATVALATVAAFAAASPPPPRDQPALSASDEDVDWRDDDRGPGHHRFHRGERRGIGRRVMAFHAAKDPSASVLRDLASLERMYRRSGREAEVAGLYRDVLAKTGDPVVRHMAGRRLARLEWRGGNKDAAIEQMKRNLDADLKRLK